MWYLLQQGGQEHKLADNIFQLMATQVSHAMWPEKCTNMYSFSL